MDCREPDNHESSGSAMNINVYFNLTLEGSDSEERRRKTLLEAYLWHLIVAKSVLY